MQLLALKSKLILFSHGRFFAEEAKSPARAPRLRRAAPWALAKLAWVSLFHGRFFAEEAKSPARARRLRRAAPWALAKLASFFVNRDYSSVSLSLIKCSRC